MGMEQKSARRIIYVGLTNDTVLSFVYFARKMGGEK